MKKTILAMWTTLLALPACGDDTQEATDEDTGSDDTTGADGSQTGDAAEETGGPGDSTDAGADSTDSTVGSTSSTATSGAESSTSGAEDSSGSETGALEPTAATIYDVQDGTIATGDAVDITGVVVTAIAPNGIFVQEPDGGEYSGVFVFPGGQGGPDLSSIALGDVVSFVGEVDEFNDFTEVDLGNGSISIDDSPGAGNVPAPEVVSGSSLTEGGGAEAWEGVFVRIESEEGPFPVSQINPDEVDGVSEFDVQVTDDTTLRVDDFLYDAVDAGDFDVTVGTSFTAIEGPLNYSFERYKIAPRSADDLEGFQGAPS